MKAKILYISGGVACIIIVVLAQMFMGGPDWTVTNRRLAINYADCVARARQAMVKEGLVVKVSRRDYVEAQSALVVATVTCVALSRGRSYASIYVLAADAESARRMRLKLDSFIRSGASYRS